MECKNCAYCYQTERDDFPTCQYEGPHEWSPCEQEDIEKQNELEKQWWEDFYRQIEEEENIC